MLPYSEAFNVFCVCALQAMFMTDLKVHHKYTPKQFVYLNYGAASSEVSVSYEIMTCASRFS